MLNVLSTRLQRLVMLLAGLLVFKVTVAVMQGYGNYFPPDFESDFLRGRELYFSGVYQWAFYAHLVSGPASLMLGLLLVNRRFLLRFPGWHRNLGRVQAGNVLLVVTPSGLWMARYASAGTLAGIGFAILSILTAACVVFGWRSAVSRQFTVHRRWMSRCFLLLCSAVVIRVIGGLGTVIGVEAPWFNPLASWVSWLVPLAAFELAGPIRQRIRRAAARQSPSPETEIHSRRLAAGVSAEWKRTVLSTNAALNPPE